MNLENYGIIRFPKFSIFIPYVQGPKYVLYTSENEKTRKYLSFFF